MAEMNKQEKTRYKLAASMKECMKSAPVDKITVKEIVEGDGKHFQKQVAGAGDF